MIFDTCVLVRFVQLFVIVSVCVFLADLEASIEMLQCSERQLAAKASKSASAVTPENRHGDGKQSRYECGLLAFELR